MLQTNYPKEHWRFDRVGTYEERVERKGFLFSLKKPGKMHERLYSIFTHLVRVCTEIQQLLMLHQTSWKNDDFSFFPFHKILVRPSLMFQRMFC